MVAEDDSDPNEVPNLPGEVNPGDPESNELSGDEVPDNTNDNPETFNSPNPQQRAGTIRVSAIDSERPRPRNRQRIAFEEDDQSQSSNHEISDMFYEEIEKRVRDRLQIERSKPPLSPATISITPSTKYIDKRSYKETSPQTVTEITAAKLEQFSRHKATNLRTMHNTLASTGLLTMLLEQRTKPIVTAMNPSDLHYLTCTILNRPPQLMMISTTIAYLLMPCQLTVKIFQFVKMTSVYSHTTKLD